MSASPAQTDTDGSHRTPLLSVIKKVRFSAAHYLWLSNLSPGENKARFGPNSNPNGHGHNYELEVTVSGPLDPDTGMVMNLKDLKTILEEEVVQPLNFMNLNRDIAYFKDKMTTLENLALMLWPNIEARLSALPVRLSGLKLFEADDLYVEYFGGEFAGQ